jgi:Fur family ferric uptake transcriptional regulator
MITIIGWRYVSTNTELRNTRQRRVIVEELERIRSHPTATELYQIVRKRLPHISLGTVYRNLEVLSHSGKIVTLQLAGSEKRFDGRTDRHYHIRCLTCGRVDDLPIQPIQAIDEALQSVTEFEVVSYRIEFLGICGCCKRTKQDEA